MEFAPAMDAYIDVRRPMVRMRVLFRFALDGPDAGLCEAEAERAAPTWRLDERLLFALITGQIVVERHGGQLHRSAGSRTSTPTTCTARSCTSPCWARSCAHKPGVLAMMAFGSFAPTACWWRPRRCRRSAAISAFSRSGSRCSRIRVVQTAASFARSTNYNCRKRPYFASGANFVRILATYWKRLDAGC